MASHQSRDSGLNQIRMAIQAHNNKSLTSNKAPIPLQPSQSSNTIPMSHQMKPNVPKMGISKTHRFVDEHRFSSYPGNSAKQNPPKMEIVERVKVMNGSGGSNTSSRKSSNVSNGLSTSLPKSRLADVKPRYLEPKKVHIAPPEIQKISNKSNASSRTASPTVVRSRKMADSKTSQDSNISLDSLSSPHRKKSSVISSKNTSKESLTFYHHGKGQKENIDKNIKGPPSVRSARSRIGSGSSTQSASHLSSLAAANRTVRNLKSKSTDTSPGNAPKSFFTQRSRNILMKREQKVTTTNSQPIQLPTSARERNKLRAQLGVASVPLPPTSKTIPLRKSTTASNNRTKVSTDLTKVKNEKNNVKKRQEQVLVDTNVVTNESVVEENNFSTTSRLERSSTFCKESSDITDLVTID